jgi:hypothetical protein
MPSDATTDLGLFPQFAIAIKALGPTGPSDDELAQFVVHNAEKLQIVYAPFDWINAQAAIVVVGITPGQHSLDAAFQAARAALLEGRSQEEAARRAKQTGSFSNMRRLIAQMLDSLHVNTILGINSTLTLFGGADASLLHSTSCVRYPVLYKNKEKRNYTGHSRPLMNYQPFREYVERMLAGELRMLPRALVVPCGEAVSQALGHLITRGDLKESRCLMGFPHASGDNGHRMRQFAQRQEALLAKVQAWAQTYRGKL